MDEEQEDLLKTVLASGEPRQDLATLFVVQAILEIHNVVDALAYEVEGKGQTNLPGRTPHKHADDLRHARKLLEAAIKAAMGKNYG